jgi:hypothetical protein
VRHHFERAINQLDPKTRCRFTRQCGDDIAFQHFENNPPPLARVFNMF